MFIAMNRFQVKKGSGEGVRDRLGYAVNPISAAWPASSSSIC